MAEAKDKKITAETEASTTELAAVLGISVRRVQQLAQDGKIVAVSRGKFNLSDSVQRYIRLCTKPPRAEEEADLGRAKQIAETRLKEAKATIAKLEAEELEGKMHRAEDVAAMTEDLIYSIRGALNALPGRLAVDVAAAGSAAEAADVIRKEVYKVMKELSEYRYDPQKYEERVRARMDWDAAEPEDDDE